MRSAFRLAAAAAVACSLSSAPALAAPTPASGTLSPTTPVVTFTGGFLLSDPSAASCGVPLSPTCDEYALSVALPADYLTQYPDAKVNVTMAFDDIDYDLYVLDANRDEVGSSGTSTPEVVEFGAASGTQSYFVQVLGWTSSGGTYTTTIALIRGDAAPAADVDGDGVADGDDDCALSGDVPVDVNGCPVADTDGDGVADADDDCAGTEPGFVVDANGCPLAQAAGLPPRYQIHVAPQALGNDAGEPSIGYNKFTKRTMFISYVNALRQTYQEDNVVPPLKPASCPAIWEDKSGLLTTVNSLDPILFTDEATGRTFNSQLSGANSLFEFTDDDGENWTPGQIGIPNGGADHQTVASGPFPAGAVPPTATWPASGDKRAVYYCSQSVAAAFCSRSDDGGQTFGPGYVFKNLDCGLGGLHGHVKVAPDGTVYVPDSSQCVLPVGSTAGNVIVHVSEDAGVTWNVHAIPTSTGGAGSDPSIGIATDGTLYMCYENADSTVHMAVSHDKGATWENDIDIGAPAGIVQSRFPHAIAGDGDRAACAFLGTTTPGNGSSLEFDGVWHGFIATTYDGGESYHLVNVTPGDPVQGHGGVGPDGTNRNLLDFNDLQIDDQGRTLFAFADGCTDACVRNPANNAFAAKATIVRQTGGRTLFAAFDDDSGTASATERYNEATPIEPAAACARDDLSARSDVQSTVVWSAPDTGGSPITGYTVYRALADTGPFTAIGNTAGTISSYIDTTTSPSVEKYYYRVEAQNAQGIAAVSNTIELAITAAEVNTCEVPGELVILDATGDSQGGEDMDIAWVGVAETRAQPDAFTITMKIANFSAGVPPPTSFYVLLFPLYGNLYLALDSTAGAPVFAYGTYEELPQGVLAFTQAGTLANSSYAADGAITFVAPRTLFGALATGADLVGFDARARLGAQSATSRDTAGPSSYTVRGIDLCPLPDAFALADLTASVLTGEAPFDVTFTISGTPSADETLQSWSLDYGDGSAPATGSFGGASTLQREHTYADVGVYRAKLTVTDSGGVTSTNLAEQTITVVPEGTLPDAEIGNNSLGGGLPALTLAVLGLAALGRRRRQG